MTTGLIESITPYNPGDVLAVASNPGDTVLIVENAGEFDERFRTPQYLVLGDETIARQYVAVQNDEESDDPQSVTLAASLTEAAEVGLPVTLWDPSVEADDKRAVVFTAMVLLDGEDDDAQPIPARIRHTMIPLAGIYTLEGARVELEEDDEGWQVVDILGRAVVVDSDVIRTPSAAGTLLGNLTVVSGGANWQTLTNFSYEVTDMAYNPTTGVWTFLKGGFYTCLFSVSFVLNPNGNRGLRARIFHPDGTEETTPTVRVPTSMDQVLGIQHFTQRMFSAGDGICFQANQNSGGDVDVYGNNVRPDAAARVTVVRSSV